MSGVTRVNSPGVPSNFGQDHCSFSTTAPDCALKRTQYSPCVALVSRSMQDNCVDSFLVLVTICSIFDEKSPWIVYVLIKNIGPHGVQEAIYIWGITRNNSRSRKGTWENTDRK